MSHRQQNRSGSLRKDAQVVSARGVIEHAFIVWPLTFSRFGMGATFTLELPVANSNGNGNGAHKGNGSNGATG